MPDDRPDILFCSPQRHSMQMTSKSDPLPRFPANQTHILSHYEWLALPHNIEASPEEAVARKRCFPVVTP